MAKDTDDISIETLQANNVSLSEKRKEELTGKVGLITEQEAYLYRSISAAFDTQYVCLSQFLPKNTGDNFSPVRNDTGVMLAQLDCGDVHTPLVLPKLKRGVCYKVKVTIEVIEELPKYDNRSRMADPEYHSKNWAKKTL